MIDFKSDSKNKHNTVINQNEKILTEKLKKTCLQVGNLEF